MQGASPWPPWHTARGVNGMARPKLSNDNLRTHRVSVFFSPAELRILGLWAEAAQMSFPAYLRERALSGWMQYQEPRRLAAEEFRELSHIGNNINQIARSLNQGLEAPGLGREDLQRLRELLSYLMPEKDER
ncbi:MAG: MobC family plasmid mobilization relaxosome protein [Gemmatimonadota bacterium]|nr:MobC family plasmid mobilization relaxosome protein [Gemmatimonadota bacterium]